MPVPIIITDDSRLSRKLLIRALPEQWAVDITEASDGGEALDALRAGKGKILFLDLTMPKVDGFEVLATMQKEGLKSTVFVVSADIQPKSKERVKSLGGTAFLEKPVQPEAVENLLQTHGLL